MAQEMVTLRTGEQVPAVLVNATFIALLALYDSVNAIDSFALYELRELARDPGHEMFPPETVAVLNHANLTDNGRLHDYTRAIVLAAVYGEEIRPPLPDGD